WARTRVTLATSMEGDRVVIAVEDDGPGIDVAKRDIVLQRGIRADETAQGSGLGLAIVRDLVETYGGSISLEESLMGGVCARLTLPAAPAAPSSGAV
ncbi:MAG: ATP-binding protein, partial [Vicinamibacterales bacterium]